MKKKTAKKVTIEQLVEELDETMYDWLHESNDRDASLKRTAYMKKERNSLNGYTVLRKLLKDYKNKIKHYVRRIKN